MPRLAVARPSDIEAIHRESFALWGAGLSPDDYRGLWEDVSSTTWAARFARFHVWVGGRRRVLSSMKLYRPRIRAVGLEGRSFVLGAIFTPRALRRRGHASDMVRSVIDDARDDGAPAALLFSDIGTRYYETFGFRPIRAEEQWGTLPRAQAPRDWSLRPAEERDRALAQVFHQAQSRRRAFAFVRDADHWEFLRVRSRSFFHRLRDRRIAQHWRIAEHRGRPAGYLITVEGRGEWNVREVGAEDGDPVVMATVLRVGAAHARRAGLRRFYGWLPPETIGHLGDWGLRCQPRHRALPMILPLAPGLDLDRMRSAADSFLPYQDQF